MSLEINDIQDKQFHVRFRGFDIDEVDEFLELVVENFSILTEDNKSLTTKVETLSEELARVKNQESSFRNAIVSAQKIADEMVKKSRKDADSLLSEAHEEIKVLKDDAHREVGELEGRVDKLSVMQSTLRQDLSDVLLSYQQKLAEIPVGNIPKELPEDLEGPRQEEKRGPLSDLEPDLSDLYEKIEIGDDLISAGSLLEGGFQKKLDDEDAGSDQKEYEGPSAASEAGSDATGIPDLGGDIMFTLEDPLDEDDSEVDVAIDGEKNNS